MLIRKPSDIPSSQITPETVWQGRRDWIARAGLAAAALGLPGWAQRAAFAQDAALPGAPNSRYAVVDKPTSFKDVTTYNNYYEFGLDKGDPAAHAGRLRTRPWEIAIEGEVGKPGVYAIDDLLKLAPMEERIYRLRCVEGWSMVIPWVGYSLSTLLQRVEPTGNAKYVEFVTAVQRDTMPGVRSSVLDWPYVEALRLDEALHPLTMLVFGVYGKVLPNQNGAPVRLAVPWKYGFKSAKSLVAIRLVEKTAGQLLDERRAARVRLLRQCQSGCAASALEPGNRAAHRRRRPVQSQAQNPDVQRLRRAGRQPLPGPGPAGQLLRSPWPMTRSRRAPPRGPCRPPP